MRRRPLPRLAGDVWPVLLAGYLLLPMRHSGVGLGRDMVFTPDQPLTDASLGLGSGTPRAVPLDAVVAVAGHVLGAAVVTRLALLVPLLAAAWGIRRLLASRSLAADLLVTGLTVWNPFVVERLALGQWALLWTYAALPWLAVIARRIRDPQRTGHWLTPWCGAVLVLAAAAITPTGALIGAVWFVVLTASRCRGRTLAAIGAAVLVQLPWVVPSLLSSSTATSDPAGVGLFASRNERGGVVTTLLGLGGIWDRDVTPQSRTGLLGVLGAVVVVVGLVLGWRGVRLALGSGSHNRLVALAAIGFALAVLAAVPGGHLLLTWMVDTVPGAGLLRDGQKWLIPFVVLAVLHSGAAVVALAERGRAAAVVAVAVGLTLPAILLPDAARTLAPTVTPSRYPHDWYTASRVVNDHRHTAVLVLPFASYRQFRWVAASSVLDPAPRWLDGDVVFDDRLAVSGHLLAGEDRRAAAVGALLRRAGPDSLVAGLAARGIGWVWVEKGTPGPEPPDLRGLTPIRSGAAIALYRVPGAVARVTVGRSHRIAVIGVDLLVLLVLAAGTLILLTIGSRACYASVLSHRPKGAPWAS